MTKTKLQIMREKNEELLRVNINMHDALDLKSERIQKLKKQLATAIGALEKSRERLGDFQEPWNDREKEVDLILSEALAEIGGEDE